MTRNGKGMKLYAALILALAASGPGALTAQTVVIPAGYERIDAPGTVFWASTPFASRQQLLIDGSLLKRFVGKSLLSISLRRNTGDNRPLTGGKTLIKLSLSHSLTSTDSASTIFASNRGSDHKQYFLRQVTLPSTGPSPTKPAPWSAPYALNLQLSRAFVYKGGTLCIESVSKPIPVIINKKVSYPWWPADGVVLDPTGSVTQFGQSCISQLQPLPAGAEPASFELGASGLFYLRGTRSPAPPLAWLMVGSSDRRMGPFKLPLDLGAFGAPSCMLYNDPLLVLFSPLQQLSQSKQLLATVELPLVNDIRLANKNIFGQWMLLDRRATRLGLSFSNGTKATIGMAKRKLGIAWIESARASSASGSILPGRSPVLKLSFR